MSLEPSLIEQIDKWRSIQKGLPSRAEAIRQLVRASLDRNSIALSDSAEGKLRAAQLRSGYRKA